MLSHLQYNEAITMASQRNIHITDAMAEAMTPTKDAVPSNVERTQLLERLADCCLEQGQYHLAAKKYAQAGNQIEVGGGKKRYLLK